MTNDEEILQTANRRLMEKRAQSKIVTAAKNPQSVSVESLVCNLKPVSNEEADRRTAERQKKERAQFVQTILKKSNVPARLSSRSVFEVCGKWQSELQKIVSKIGTGFLIGLIGDRGTGKSQIAERVIKAAAEKERSCFYITATMLFCEIKRAYQANSENTEHDLICRFQKYKLLVIDEIGRRAANDWEDRILFEIIDGRYRELRDTLLISNQTQQEFESSAGESIVSRLNETGGIVNAKIEDGWKCFRE